MNDEPLVGLLPGRVVEVTGSDRLSYLEDVLSQHVTEMAPGDVAGAMLLDPQGRPQGVFDVAVLEDRLLLIVEDAALADEVAAFLGGRTFLNDARFTITDLRVLALRGDQAHQAAETADLDAAPWSVLTRDGVTVVGRPGGIDLLGTPEDLDALDARLTEAGARRGDDAALEAWRVAAGVPSWGREVAAPHLPEELGLLPTHVHLAKGCYPGQEAVARMWMLGRPRRRLATLDLDPGVEAGWQEGSGRRRVEVTSAAVHGGRRCGLGFVPADAAAGDHLGPEGAGVTVRAVVGADLPVPGHDPTVRRRRDQRG